MQPVGCVYCLWPSLSPYALAGYMVSSFEFPVFVEWLSFYAFYTLFTLKHTLRCMVPNEHHKQNKNFQGPLLFLLCPLLERYANYIFFFIKGYTVKALSGALNWSTEIAWNKVSVMCNSWVDLFPCLQCVYTFWGTAESVCMGSLQVVTDSTLILRTWLATSQSSSSSGVGCSWPQASVLWVPCLMFNNNNARLVCYWMQNYCRILIKDAHL